MNEKRIELINLDRAIAVVSLFMEPGAPKGSGILKAPPYQSAYAGIHWAWLQWQKEPDFESISRKLVSIGERAASPEAVSDADERGLRGEFDWFLLCCAVLSGDRTSMHRAAERAAVATLEPGSRHNIFQAAAGVLKARISGDANQETEQIELAERLKPYGPHPIASRAMLRSFNKRDYAAVAKEVMKGAKKHWTDSYMGKKSMPVIVHEGPDRIVLDISQKSGYVTWAYVEGVFAKLSMLDGGTIDYDDFWLPLGLISPRANLSRT
jgi:hypothetical protein